MSAPELIKCVGMIGAFCCRHFYSLPPGKTSSFFADAAEKINNGDEIEIDYKKGVIKNKTQKKEFTFKPLPDFAIEIINDGGLLEHIKK